MPPDTGSSWPVDYQGKTIRNRFQRLLDSQPGDMQADDHFKTLLLAHLLMDGQDKLDRKPEIL